MLIPLIILQRQVSWALAQRSQSPVFLLDQGPTALITREN